MVFINAFRFGAIVLGVYISLNSWVEAFASTDSFQLSSTAISLVSPSNGLVNASVSVFSKATSFNSTSSPVSHVTSNTTEVSPISGLANASVSAFQIPTSLNATSSLVSHITSSTTEVSPISGLANASVSAFQIPTSLNATSSLVSHITPSATQASTLIKIHTTSPSSRFTNTATTVTKKSTTTRSILKSTSASPNSHDLSMSATKSIFKPTAPPSNAHIAKLAEIIVPSVVGGAGIGSALWKLFGNIAQRGQSAISVARSLRMARQTQLLDKLSPQQAAWDKYYMRRTLMEEGRKPGTLTAEQVNGIRAVENGGESIWNGGVRSIATFGKVRSLLTSHRTFRLYRNPVLGPRFV